jgi:hypothetical protein
MAVREFDGIDDFCRLSIGTGGLAATTYGTFAAMFKVTDTAALRALFCFLNSSGSFIWMPMAVDSSDRIMYHGNSDRPLAAAIPQGVWLSMWVRKATGTATPRFSYWNHSTLAWTHGDGNGTTGDGAAPTGGFINTATNSFATERFDGRIAVTAAWANTVVWSADTTGDAAIEAAFPFDGVGVTLQDWVDESPTGLWPWNPTVAAGIVDITGGGADQSTIAGTAQITDDDPPGFSFDLGGEPPPELEEGPQMVIHRSNLRLG